MFDLDAPHVQEIRRQMWRLDEVAVKMETKWGYDGLVPLVSAETARKWKAQKDKLDKAIRSENVADITALVDGTIRGYEKLEAEALAAGYTPHKPEVWDFTHPESGRHYRICKTLLDARRMAQEGVVVYTLGEVARILEANQLVNVVKETLGGEVTKIGPKDDFDWEQGDEIPFI